MRRVMLSRFAQVSTTALIALVLAGAARADTIKGFVVKGTAENTSGMDLGSCEENSVCSFSGTMMVDVTSSTMFPHGRVTASDITFPGLVAFNIIIFDEPILGNEWGTDSENHLETEALALEFTTGHTPASLVGFDGGSIEGAFVVNFTHILYDDLHGSITPAAAVPEPSSLVLLGTGLIGLAGMARRKLKLGT